MYAYITYCNNMPRHVYVIKADVVIHKSCLGYTGRARYVCIHTHTHSYIHKYTHKDIHYIHKITEAYVS